MLAQAFDCPSCNKTFDCKEGEPRTPVFSTAYQVIRCRTCSSDPLYVPQKGLMAFLDQPAFKKTDKGYEYNWPINDPGCFGCQENIKLCDNDKAFVAECGHYLCLSCNDKRKNKVIFSCGTCSVVGADTERMLPQDSTLEGFSSIMKNNEEWKERAAELEKFKAIEAQKEEDRKNGAMKDCSDCGREQEIEYLYSCKDCQTVLCGVCSFDSHHSHAVVKLLGIELDQMEQRSDKRYTENLEGLHGNLKYIQTTIDEAVEKVMKAGKERLVQIKACTKHRDAQKIVVKVDDAADKFEKHCEVYIPVARQLATHLTELGEDLMKNEE